MRSRVTFANVTSLLALFIALGGTGYAVSRIDGRRIVDRSIAARKIKAHSLSAVEVREAALARKTVQLVVSQGRRSKRRTAAPGVGLVTLSVGQTATLLTSGPFTYELICGGTTDQPRVQIAASSTEAGTIIDFASNADGSNVRAPAELQPGEKGYLMPPIPDHFGFVSNGKEMLAPSGAALHVGSMIYGTRLFGADCAGSAFAVG